MDPFYTDLIKVWESGGPGGTPGGWAAYYYGVFENNQLVSMAGERLHLTNYSEISAVCTHPAYTGKRLGTELVAHMMEEIIEQGKTPFLHVRVDNLAAIQLYEKLGFQVRREMYFAVFNITEKAPALSK